MVARPSCVNKLTHHRVLCFRPDTTSVVLHSLLAPAVHLTQTDPKGKESKSKMVEAVRAAIDELSYAYVFAYENMRTTFFQSVRKEWPDSKFFLSKNKVMQVALGRDEETEYGTGLHKVAQCIKGNVGLLVTNHPLDEVCALSCRNAGACTSPKRVATHSTSFTAHLRACFPAVLHPPRCALALRNTWS